MNLLIDLHYLPGIEYFMLLEFFDRTYLEANENYQKQTWRNRCRIRGPNKVQMLTVPVRKPSGKVPVTEVQIDHSRDWIGHHIKSIRTAYGNAPFFEYYAGELFAILEKKSDSLFETNRSLLIRCLDLLGSEKKVLLTDRYDHTSGPQVADLRNYFGRPDSNPTLSIEYEEYYQVFGEGFARNMSIIDLLFCEGPGALQFLRSATVQLNDQRD